MKVVPAICTLLVLLIVPNAVFVFYQAKFPYFAYAIIAGEFAGMFSYVYHSVLIQPGMLFYKLPAWLESWAYNSTIGKPLPIVKVQDGTGLIEATPQVDNRMEKYHQRMWLVKPYRECCECLAGQLGIVAWLLSFFSVGFNFWGLIAIPSVAILTVSTLGHLWSKKEKTPGTM